mmetsp:Transcript_30728/g.45818  ORF Transcript_30728/g.45818 Transcript_30728/m.45818 type:complete len:132 (-) Transcript_30728:54-449(-)
MGEVELWIIGCNPKKDKPWFVISGKTLIPLCNAHDHAHLQFHNNMSETNRMQYHEKEKAVTKAVIAAKELWAQRLTIDTMKYADDPIKSWKATWTPEKGLTHHHTQCQTIQMCKEDGEKAKTDEENAKVFP